MTETTMTKPKRTLEQTVSYVLAEFHMHPTMRTLLESAYWTHVQAQEKDTKAELRKAIQYRDDCRSTAVMTAADLQAAEELVIEAARAFVSVPEPEKESIPPTVDEANRNKPSNTLLTSTEYSNAKGYMKTYAEAVEIGTMNQRHFLDQALQYIEGCVVQRVAIMLEGYAESYRMMGVQARPLASSVAYDISTNMIGALSKKGDFSKPAAVASDLAPTYIQVGTMGTRRDVDGDLFPAVNWQGRAPLSGALLYVQVLAKNEPKPA
jgi:hypothetical protein